MIQNCQKVKTKICITQKIFIGFKNDTSDVKRATMTYLKILWMRIITFCSILNF